MSNKQDSSTVPTPPPPYLVFVQNHRPGLKSGDYELTLEHEIKGTGIDTDNKTVAPIPFYFAVLGDRFSLPDPHLHSVFPPPGSLGEYSNVLPHVIFNRSTLPWERLAAPAAPTGMSQDDFEGIPWLALLVFNPEDLAFNPADPVKNPDGTDLSADQKQHVAETGRVVTLSSLQASSKGWSGVDDLESADPNDKVRVIYVKQSTLANIMPTTDELTYLSHVRLGSSDAQGTGATNEMAVVIANCLPQLNGNSIIHLVSVERRYQKDKTFNYNGANGDELVTLVTLKSWRIACITPKESFEQLLQNLDKGIPALPIPSNMESGDGMNLLKMGFLPQPHHFRRGGKSISWYHGPLAPGTYTKSLDPDNFPIHAADELLRYDQKNGMFDVSYAAAWELGRLLCLQQKKVSVKLYHWKRQHMQQMHQAEQRLAHPHLPLTSAQHNGQASPELPVEVENWFSDISLLKGVPFNYLLPDERLLPKESIRFFELDPSWIASLLDGAFSIGRVIGQDKAVDKNLRARLGDTYSDQDMVSGFILRSAAVAGWPGLLIEGFDSEPDQAYENQPYNKSALPILRQERIAPNILICLFSGDLQTLDIYLKPEVLHFGVDIDAHDPSKFTKKLRNADGTEREDKQIIRTEDQTLNAQRKVDVNSLFNAIKSNGPALGFDKDQKFTAAQFALEMIEGVPKLRFLRG